MDAKLRASFTGDLSLLLPSLSAEQAIRYI